MEKETLLLIGYNIRQLRSNNKISQKQLALMCGMEKSAMSRIEAGKINITMGSLLRISKALEIPLKVLFEQQELSTEEKQQPALVQ